MSKSKKLKLVARFEELQQRKQLSKMLAAQRDQQSQQQLTQRLQEYYSDYTYINEKSETPVRASSLRNTSRFMCDLDKALELQKNRASISAKQHLEEKESWLQMHARSSALERLIDKAEQQEFLEETNKADIVADDQWSTNFSRKPRF